MTERLQVAERRAIQAHYEQMRLVMGAQVSFEHAREDWLQHHAVRWREELQRRMLSLQRLEIERHKWIESEKAQRDLGREAVMDWVLNHAAQWREWYEREYQADIA